MELPKKFGNTPLKRLAKLYSDIYFAEFGLVPKVDIIRKDGSVFRSLLKEYDEAHVASFIVVHFTWMGVDNNNQKEYQRLRDKAFPITWLSHQINQYNIFLSKIIPKVYSNHLEFVKSYYKTKV